MATWREAVVGKRYKVVLNDCCMVAEFTATLSAKVLVGSVPVEDQNYLDRLEFNNGVVVSRADSDGVLLLTEVPGG
jgi:hypothetical protein